MNYLSLTINMNLLSIVLSLKITNVKYFYTHAYAFKFDILQIHKINK